MAKKATTGSTYFSEDLEKQRAFVKHLKDTGFNYPLVAAEAFVRGMRDSGYKSTATALDELIDNAIQAQATFVDIILGSNTTGAKVERIAVVDNGHGMDDDMIRLSVLWGGTHREGDRSGWGKYGFGLKSASVSIARRFSVYSKSPGGAWHVVTIDIDDVTAGKLTVKGVVRVPDAVEQAPPDWVMKALEAKDAKLDHGTVVVLEKLDRLTSGFVLTQKCEEKLLHHIGLVYRDILRTVRLRVVDAGATVKRTVVDPIDPLFLRPDARYYDENKAHARALPETRFRVKHPETKDADLGTVRVRYAYMAPEFTKGTKGRMQVRKENNGFIVMRAGRQIDVVRQNPWTVIRNNDKFCGIEIDFDPTLDEEFGVTTNKQQITVSDRMWDLLKQNGVWSAFKQLRKDYDTAAESVKRSEQPEEKESEVVAAKTAKHRRSKAVPPSPAKEAESRRELDEEVDRVARTKGKKRHEAEAEIEAKPYKVDFEDLPGAPFYRMKQIGGQKRLLINTAHRFYMDVYSGPETNARTQTSLELLLIVLGECELDAFPDKEKFYREERNEWSRRLETVLEQLDDDTPLSDAREARHAEREESDDDQPMA